MEEGSEDKPKPKRRFKHWVKAAAETFAWVTRTMAMIAFGLFIGWLVGGLTVGPTLFFITITGISLISYLIADRIAEKQKDIFFAGILFTLGTIAATATILALIFLNIPIIPIILGFFLSNVFFVGAIMSGIVAPSTDTSNAPQQAHPQTVAKDRIPSLLTKAHISKILYDSNQTNSGRPGNWEKFVIYFKDPKTEIDRPVIFPANYGDDADTFKAIFYHAQKLGYIDNNLSILDFIEIIESDLFNSARVTPEMEITIDPRSQVARDSKMEKLKQDNDFVDDASVADLLERSKRFITSKAQDGSPQAPEQRSHVIVRGATLIQQPPQPSENGSDVGADLSNLSKQAAVSNPPKEPSNLEAEKTCLSQ